MFFRSPPKIAPLPQVHNTPPVKRECRSPTHPASSDDFSWIEIQEDSSFELVSADEATVVHENRNEDATLEERYDDELMEQGHKRDSLARSSPWHVEWSNIPTLPPPEGYQFQDAVRVPLNSVRTLEVVMERLFVFMDSKSGCLATPYFSFPDHVVLDCRSLLTITPDFVIVFWREPEPNTLLLDFRHYRSSALDNVQMMLMKRHIHDAIALPSDERPNKNSAPNPEAIRAILLADCTSTMNTPSTRTVQAIRPGLVFYNELPRTQSLRELMFQGLHPHDIPNRFSRRQKFQQRQLDVKKQRWKENRKRNRRLRGPMGRRGVRK